MNHTEELLFVYGTLLSGVPSSMSKFLRKRGELIGRGRVSGRLVDLGGYPGFVGGGGSVKGEVYRLHADRAGETWQMLDAYEGVSGLASEDYRKTTVSVSLERGGTVKATTYELQHSPGGKPEIPGGDYLPFYKSSSAHRKFTGHD